MLFAFVVSGLVSSVLSQEIGWQERLRSDLFCVVSSGMQLSSIFSYGKLERISQHSAAPAPANRSVKSRVNARLDGSQRYDGTAIKRQQ